jgi:hypothetical protein
MVSKLAVLSCVLFACTSDGKSPVDAAAVHDAPKVVDGPASSTDAPATDAALAACTGALYDSCTGNTGCMSQDCKVFGSAGLGVCTQACSSTNPCPAQNGTPISCNNMGICRPNAANPCTPP